MRDAIVPRTTERALAYAGFIATGGRSGMHYAKSDGQPF